VRGHGCLEEKGANDIISCAENVLSLAVLLRGIRARHTERDAFGKEEGVGSGVVEFATIITLNRFNATPELSESTGKEVRKSRKRVRLKTKRESPQKMSVIIENS
jgi:hypothetical protein